MTIAPRLLTPDELGAIVTLAERHAPGRARCSCSIACRDRAALLGHLAALEAAGERALGRAAELAQAAAELAQADAAADRDW